MAKKYGHHGNIIYEIYNEPLENTHWDSIVKPYSEKVISAIRAIDPDNIILVGSPTWSQDVDVVAKNPIVGFENIAYTLHFYAGTHNQSLRNKAQLALDAGLALFVSEWGTVNANGDGNIDVESTEQWLAFMRKNNISHCSWAVSNKNEMSAMLKQTASVAGNWTDKDLTKNGLYLKRIIQQWGL
jgi:endoglucanase